MPRFVFQLDGVLRHRERVEQNCQRDVAVAQREMAQLESLLQALNRQVQASITDVRSNHLVGLLDMNYLAAHRRYMLGMHRKVIDLAQRMAAQQQKLDTVRRALAEASRQKKIIEKLRERRREQWVASLDRREAVDLDEISTQLSHRDLAAGAEGLQ